MMPAECGGKERNQGVAAGDALHKKVRARLIGPALFQITVNHLCSSAHWVSPSQLGLFARVGLTIGPL